MAQRRESPQRSDAASNRESVFESVKNGLVATIGAPATS